MGTSDLPYGYTPDPDWTKLPPFKELLDEAFGPKGIIRDTSHPVYRDLIGEKPTGGDDNGGDL
jgi:hypothetical protein